MKKRPELLAPAGSLEKLQYAFAYGADAVYLGIPDFSLRVRINRFDLSDVEKAIKLAHQWKKKIYITINIYARNEHLARLPKYLKQLNTWKPDAFIISDPGIMVLAKKYAPKIPIHISTQANVTNWGAVKFWADQGASRIILGREVTLQEIKEIHKKYPKIELEYFVHGAMCMSYSGRCMLSAWLTERSANLGDCAQPCRWRYDVKDAEQIVLRANLEEEKRLGMKIPVEEDQNGTYIFNSKDLCLIEYLPQLIDAGICSFKIEGRAKSVAYLASVIKAYSEGLAIVESRKYKAFVPSSGRGVESRELKKLKKRYLDPLLNRGYTTGFLLGRETVEQNTSNSHVGGDEQFVGEIIGGDEKYIIVKPHNKLEVGDKVKIMQPLGNDLRITVKKMYNEKDKELDVAHGGEGKFVKILVNKNISKYSIIFLVHSEPLKGVRNLS